MRTRARRFVVLLAVLLLVGGGALAARALTSNPGGGTLTRGIAFDGLGSGEEFPPAGTGTVHAGSSKAEVTILLPAFAIPGAGGGGDENHVVATIQGYRPGYWIVGAKIRPFHSDYNRNAGTLVVWLNKPATSPISFSFLAFGIYND
jgi:hypothetical protein